MSRRALAMACALAGLLGLPASVPAAPVAPPAGLKALVGAMHEHSSYSDGWPGTRPADYYASAKGYGIDFLAGADHSDNLGVPAVFSEACYGEGRGGTGEVLLIECLFADQVNRQDSFRKWDATGEQAAAATSSGFAGIRGFEWSADRFGHIDVFFSRNYTSSKVDGGEADMDTFWRWFTTAPTLGGGSDGLGTFNHPSAKKIDFQGTEAPGKNWNDFRYVPAADERMVGLEVFNDKREYGSRDDYPEGAYAHALDRGWHLGAVGAEDLGHRKPPLDNWGGPEWPKTVVLAPERTPEAIRAAMLDRRFYAVGPGESALRMSLTVDREPMGSRLTRPTGDPLAIKARISDADLKLDLITSGGKVVDSGNGEISLSRAAAGAEKYYFVRASRADRPVAYSSPVWVTARAGAPEGSWRAGDLHVHSCYSGDAYCGPGDDSGPKEFFSFGGTVANRFAEASVRGLDYLAITDHNDIRSQADPDFGSQGVVGVRGYENSLAGGHAQMLGARKVYANGAGDVAATNDLADALEGDGGIFQINHPSYRGDKKFDSCDQASLASKDNPLHWKYGFGVRPTVIEVFNTTALIQPAELYWECWLQRGFHIGATGGSDSHGTNQANLGNPTTHVFSPSNTEAGVLQGLREGRTTISRLSPQQSGLKLLLEGDGDGNGSFEAMVGDTVKPGTKMRVRADGASSSGFVRVRANGKTLLDDAPLGPGQSVTFNAPPEPGWVRATLFLQQSSSDVDPSCQSGPISGGSPIDICSSDLAIAAITSPIYTEKPEAPVAPVDDEKPGPGAEGPSGGGRPSDDGEESREPPLSPGQDPGSGDLPDVPRQQGGGAETRGGAALPRVSVRISRLGRKDRVTRRYRVRWKPAGRRYDVQVRPRGGAWRVLSFQTRRTSIVFRVRPGQRYTFRVRLRPPDGRIGPWQRSRVLRTR